MNNTRILKSVNGLILFSYFPYLALLFNYYHLNQKFWAFVGLNCSKCA